MDESAAVEEAVAETAASAGDGAGDVAEEMVAESAVGAQVVDAADASAGQAEQAEQAEGDPSKGAESAAGLSAVGALGGEGAAAEVAGGAGARVGEVGAPGDGVEVAGVAARMGDGLAAGLAAVEGVVAREVVGERARKKGSGGGKAGVVEPVAVVGLAGRFPGAGSVGEFWENLVGGVESVRRFSEEELRGAGGGEAFGDEELVAVSGALDDVELFDAAFFGLSDREAELTDPAQRLFLEVCQQALEHGGYAGASGRIGIFAGSGMNLYTQESQPPDYLATRVAYRLGLTGPAIGVQAAWSSSLVAVHLACQALRSGDADLALAGAAAVHVPQATGYHASARLDPVADRPCPRVRRRRRRHRRWQRRRGGAAEAARPGDRRRRHRVRRDQGFRGHNDGPDGQVELVERALEKSGVPAASISYVEANATGTPADDTVEFRALTTALRKHTDEVGFCTIGSVKPNIGHLDSAAGMAGLIKTILMLQHRTLVPTINYRRAEPGPGRCRQPLRGRYRGRATGKPVRRCAPASAHSMPRAPVRT